MPSSHSFDKIKPLFCRGEGWGGERSKSGVVVRAFASHRCGEDQSHIWLEFIVGS